MNLRDALRAPLALRIYLVGLVQLAVVAACVPPSTFMPVGHSSDPALLACNAKPLRFSNDIGSRVEPMALPAALPESGARVVLCVFLVVGVSSLLLARTVTRPLRSLASAARAFGAGDLKARAAVPNRDEIGDVSQAFDEMADRVARRLRAEKELLASVSHELRTPLARIRVALEIVAEKNGDNTSIKNMLGEIAIDLDELERLTSDVVMAARLGAEDAASPAELPLRRRRVGIGDLLKQAASRFCSLHPQRPLLIYVPEGLPEVDADPALLRRVFDNLLENAHKYTDEPSEPIELVARAGEALTVDVIDSGIGIDAEDISRVFRPFFRVGKSRGASGLGLGLPLAKRIVEAHGGAIELVSTPNQGTRARVRLPTDTESGVTIGHTNVTVV